MKHLCALLLLLLCRAASAQVILSEVLFNPRGNENAYEFIEIYNANPAAAVLLTGWKIGDQTETDLLVSPDSLYRLAPGQFAVILDPNYFQSPAVYDSLIPAQALILTINDNSFGSGGLSNSTAETLVLLDALDRPVARYTYSLGNADGISDEKIFLTSDDSPANWANSRRVDGTPGQRNSVTPHRLDGELLAHSFSVSPAVLREGQAAKLGVTLRNSGLEQITAAAVEFSIIKSSADLTLPFHLGSVELPGALESTDSLRLGVEWKSAVAGRHEILAHLILSGDENLANDSLRMNINIGYAREAVRINEIMYAPPPSQPEWIEIFNPQPTALSLTDWVLQDESNTRAAIKNKATIPPLSYRVLAANPSVAGAFGIADSLVIVLDNFPALNNAGDVLLLRDFSGAVIDSAAYQTSWGAPGIAAEKIWPERENVTENWRPSQHPRGGTPAALNSVSPREVDLAAMRLRFDPPKSRAGDDVRLIATIRNHGRRTIERFTAAVEFLIVSTSAHLNLPFRLGSVELPFALLSDDSIDLSIEWKQTPAGRHEILARLLLPNDQKRANDSLRANFDVGFRRETVRLNEIMYHPLSSQPEWIEIFNPQLTPVSLADWRLQDDDNQSVIPSHAIIPASGYLVLAKSAVVADTFRIADSLVVVPAGFPGLNNGGDLLLLLDFTSVVIDSATYQPNWGAPGIAAEKIWFERENVTANWQPSRETRGGTPAAFNSVSPREIDLAATRLRFAPLRPRAGEEVQLIATVRNSGRRDVERFAATFAHDRNQDNEIQSGEEIGRVTVSSLISPEDSISVQQIWPQPPSGKSQVLVAIAAPLDAAPNNNRLAVTLPAGYRARSVVMNEIYYAPRAGEVEWVEFYNRSPQPVDLSAWRWRDADASSFVVFPDSAAILAPGALALFAAGRNIANAEPGANVIVPKNWLTLNNDQETLVLADFNGHAQDSLSFSQHWGGDTGLSLERINPNLAGNDSSNWSSAVATTGNTPGKRNSIFTEFVPQQATITVSPQPFSPDGDGHDDFAIIQFQVPAATATAQVKIFDVRGRLVHQLLNNKPVGATHEVLWNGRDEARQLLPTGIYIVYLQAIQASGGVLVEARTTLVLARKLK